MLIPCPGRKSLRMEMELAELSDWLRRLMDTGLSEREAKLYLALLQHPDSTVNELQRSSSIPRTKVYETLGRMIEHRLCFERQVGSVRRYSPVEPRTVMEFRKEQMASQLAAQATAMESLGAELTELHATRERSPVSLEYVEVMRTRKQIGERLAYLIENCRDELLAFSKFPPPVQTVEAADDWTLRSLRRIKNVLSIYEIGTEWKPEHTAYVKKWHDAGEQSRFVRSLPTRLLVMDTLYALIFFRDAAEPAFEASVLLTNHELALAIRTLFIHQWDEAITYDDFIANQGKFLAQK